MTLLQQIKIDLDRRLGPCSWKRWCKRASVVLGILSVPVHHFEVRTTERGYHVVFYTEPQFLSDLQLVAVQAMMGSDYAREAINLRRINEGQKDWNLLFARKTIFDERGEVKYQSQESKRRADLESVMRTVYADMLKREMELGRLEWESEKPDKEFDISRGRQEPLHG